MIDPIILVGTMNVIFVVVVLYWILKKGGIND